MTPTDLFEGIRPMIKTLLERDGRIDMVAFFYWGKTKKLQVMPIPNEMCENAQSKDRLNIMLGKYIQTEKPDMMVMVMEVWMLKTKDRAEVDRIGPDGIASHPEKEEAVFVTGESAFGTTSWSAPILRGEDGKATLGEFENLGMDLKGRFAHLFVPLAEDVN